MASGNGLLHPLMTPHEAWAVSPGTGPPLCGPGLGPAGSVGAVIPHRVRASRTRPTELAETLTVVPVLSVSLAVLVKTKMSGTLGAQAPAGSQPGHQAAQGPACYPHFSCGGSGPGEASGISSAQRLQPNVALLSVLTSSWSAECEGSGFHM